MSHKIEDVPRLLSKELILNVSTVRVRNAMHRIRIIPSDGQITRSDYVLLKQYFKDRELVSRQDARQMIMMVGRETAKSILGKTDKWFDSIDYNIVMMNVREFNKLDKFYLKHSALVR